MRLPDISSVPVSSWDRLSEKKIYFGHQSVGLNIIEGIGDLTSDNPEIKIDVRRTEGVPQFNGPGLLHGLVGENMNPQSKIDAFSEIVDGGVGDDADVAFFKFCYIDIEPGTDIEGVFQAYKQKMAYLKQKYPDTTFVHVTVPLKTRRKNLKTLVKGLLGKPEPNIQRNEYNDLMRETYKGKEPLFDLAAVESICPDGTRSTFVKNGKEYDSLVPEYTYDDGHLNETGRKKVAEQLLIFLAEQSHK